MRNASLTRQRPDAAREVPTLGQSDHTAHQRGPHKAAQGRRLAKAIGKELTTYNVATMEDIDKVVEALK